MPAARPLGADLGRGRRREHYVAGAAGRTRAARHRCALHHLHLPGCRTKLVYRAMSRRSASRPACVSFNLVPPSSSKPHPFRRWIATQSISRSRSSASATCFNVIFSDGLRRGSGVFGLSIAGRSLYRTGANHRRPRSISCTRGDASLTRKSRGNNPRRAGRRLETISRMVRPRAGSYPHYSLSTSGGQAWAWFSRSGPDVRPTDLAHASRTSNYRPDCAHPRRSRWLMLRPEPDVRLGSGLRLFETRLEFRTLLRLRKKREAASDGRSSRQSITSSARKRSSRGIIRPRDLVVVAFTTSSNRVGCSTGISAALAPFRILETMIAACRNMAVRLGP
jgi:hypothetical protein